MRKDITTHNNLAQFKLENKQNKENNCDLQV